MYDIKRKIYERIEPCWNIEKMPEDYSEDDKKAWINRAILVYIKDNMPRGSMKYGRRPECEFCGRRHTRHDDICDPEVNKLRGNTLEHVD